MTRGRLERYKEWADIDKSSVIMEYLDTQITVNKHDLCDAGRCSMGDASDYYRADLEYYMETKKELDEMIARGLTADEIKGFYEELYKAHRTQKLKDITDILNEYGLN